MEGKRLSKPSFFKVLINEDFTRQLRLPTLFVQNHGERFSKNAILRASSEESWVVKLEHIEDEKCYFTLGWQKFAEDLELTVGEFLVFWLTGKSTFDVSVYGISGCERKISNCKSEFESSDSDEEVEILSKDYASTKRRSEHDVSNKRAKTSIMEKEVARCPGNVDRSSPLYFELVLKKHHRPGVILSKIRKVSYNSVWFCGLCLNKNLRLEFTKMSGLIRQKRVKVEYVPKQCFTSAALDRRPGRFRFHMAWAGFIKENGLVYGRTYSFEFNPIKNVIQIDEIKKEK